MPIVKNRTLNVNTGEIEEIYFTPEEEIVFLEKRAIAESAIFPEAQIAFVKKIDADVDAIYADAIGNRATEYELAEKEALTYQAASYSGPAPASVSAWSEAKKESAKWAADDIISTSSNWRFAQSSIRLHRLITKEAAKNADDMATLSVIQADWNEFVAVSRSYLGL